MFEFFNKIVKPQPCDTEIEKTWAQVGTLTLEDNGRKRNLLAMVEERGHEHALLQKKMNVIRAQIDVDDEEWWIYLRKAYGIPQRGNFHITEDGRIFMEPKR